MEAKRKYMKWNRFARKNCAVPARQFRKDPNSNSREKVPGENGLKSASLSDPIRRKVHISISRFDIAGAV